MQSTLKRIMVWGIVIVLGASFLYLAAVQEPLKQLTRLSDQLFGPIRMIGFFPSWDSMMTVKNPEKVWLYQIHYVNSAFPYDLTRATLSEPVLLADSEAKLVSQEISNLAVYNEAESSFTTCEPVWGIRVVFVKDAKKVAALYCEHCKHIVMDMTGERGLASFQVGKQAEQDKWTQLQLPSLEAISVKYFPPAKT